MLKLFEIENNTVVPTEHCYTIKWLKDIMDKYPDDFIQIYAYIFYMTCPSEENPYFNTREEDREEKVLESMDANFSTEDELILTGIEEALKLYETPSLRAYLGIKMAMDNIASYMSGTPITDGKDGNIGQIRQMAKDFDSIRQSFKGMAKDLEEEQKNQHVRGGKNLAYDQ